MTDAVQYQPSLSRWGVVWRVLFMLFISGVVMLEPYGRLADSHPWWIPIDVVIGVLAYVLIHHRRRRPLLVLTLVLVLAAVSSAAAGPAILAMVSLATRRVPWEIAVGAVLSVVSAETYAKLAPITTPDPVWLGITGNIVAVMAMVAWGMYIGSRRELLWTLRQRAERAESERDLRSGKARADERARIAREMHDVLAHRISQVAMHAGALSFRTDLDADALRSGIGEVQVRANEALTDLRGVLGVLRDPVSGEITHRPQPTYADLPQLVAEATAAGARVSFEDQLDEDPPAAVGRTLYRIVQEGITNAHKHAPGALLSVCLEQADEGVAVRMRNPFGFGTPGAPGAGLGLVGLTERVDLAGGRLVYGREGDVFSVEVWLPWSP